MAEVVDGALVALLPFNGLLDILFQLIQLFLQINLIFQAWWLEIIRYIVMKT